MVWWQKACWQMSHCSSALDHRCIKLKVSGWGLPCDNLFSNLCFEFLQNVCLREGGQRFLGVLWKLQCQRLWCYFLAGKFTKQYLSSALSPAGFVGCKVWKIGASTCIFTWIKRRQRRCQKEDLIHSFLDASVNCCFSSAGPLWM